MEKYKVRFSFVNEKTTTLELLGDSIESLFSFLTGHKDWYVNSELETAINMQLVTNIAIAIPAKLHSGKGIIR